MTPLLAPAPAIHWFTLVLAAGLLGGCAPEAPEQTAAEPPAVGVIEVGERKVNPFLEFVAKTRATETVALRARVTGFLEERGFEEGGKVEKGQVLFRIEPEQFLATQAQAQASQAAAEASLKRAQVDLARYKELAKTKNVSQQKVDEADAEVLVQEAAVRAAQADVEKSKLNVAYTEITAPISGRIDVASYDVGNLVGPDSGVMATINQMDPIKVAFSIAETWYLDLVQADIAEQRAGRKGDDQAHVPLIRLPDGTLYSDAKGEPIRGSFDFVDNKVDERTGTVFVRARFPNAERLLLPGQFVTVVIERKEAVNAVLVPQAAVLTDQSGYNVLVVNDQNKVEQRRIETGQRFGPDWLVEKGLEPGEHIILFGIQKVRPGLEVKPELTQAPEPQLGMASGDAKLAETMDAAQAAGEGAEVGTGDAPPDAAADGESSDASN